MDLELNDKTAIVTGGSKGIGKAIARELSREGVDVVIAARNIAGLEATAHELEAETGRRIVPIQTDTGDDDAIRNLVQKANDTLGHIDILVNNAAKPGGQGHVPSFEGITNDLFWDDMNVKVMGYLRCAREVAPLMKKRGWGRIINISGMAARSSGSTLGSMRNVAVSAMTKNMADELGPHGINVTVVHPGATRTEATAGLVKVRAEAEGISPAEIEAGMAQRNTVRRLIDATEVAYVVAFLASPKAGSITGDAIAAGGGAGPSIHY
jgi:NAD(P)-dependent dehydrogenase (short-subunit alcohol dehydrogenase family)